MLVFLEHGRRLRGEITAGATQQKNVRRVFPYKHDTWGVKLCHKTDNVGCKCAIWRGQRWQRRAWQLRAWRGQRWYTLSSKVARSTDMLDLVDEFPVEQQCSAPIGRVTGRQRD